MRVLFAAMLVAATTPSALAQRAPEIVIPGKPGVPVYINGVDASWGIIEGDFGLDRPDMAAPRLVYRPPLARSPSRVPGYYPADGRHPGYGRLEIPPPRNRVLPPPAPPYFRQWWSNSAPGPLTADPPYLPGPIAPRPVPRQGDQGARLPPSHWGSNHRNP